MCSKIDVPKINALLMLLEAEDTLVPNELHTIKAQTTPLDKMTVLIDCIANSTNKAFDDFVEALEDDAVGLNAIADQIKQMDV